MKLWSINLFAWKVGQRMFKRKGDLSQVSKLPYFEINIGAVGYLSASSLSMKNLLFDNKFKDFFIFLAY